jgi:hypothetical protein
MYYIKHEQLDKRKDVNGQLLNRRTHSKQVVIAPRHNG